MAPLSDYPRPNVAVDVAVLTIANGGTHLGQLAALVLDSTVSPAGFVVPGRFLREGETTHACIEITLRQKAGLSTGTVEPRLLKVFDAPDRDPRGWTISLGHLVVLPRVDGRLVPVDAMPPMLFDHDVIVAAAVDDVRRRYETSPDPDGLLTGPFTLSELRALHEAVLGERLRRDTFRRRMESRLRPVGGDGQQSRRADGGRPARLWTVGPSTSCEVSSFRLPRDSR